MISLSYEVNIDHVYS